MADTGRGKSIEVVVVDLEGGVAEMEPTLRSRWVDPKLVGACLLLLGLGFAAATVKPQGEVTVSGERRLEETVVASIIPVIAWLFMVTLAVGIQFIAYKRSRFSPHPLKDGQQMDLSNQDIYGDQLELKQQWKAKELCGCEAKNRYMSKDEKFYIDEQSDCCQRLFASTNRELTLFGHAGNSGDAPVALRMYKPYHLQGCCFCRPSLQVDMADGTKIGTIEDPFKCCTMDQQILDKSGGTKFTVAGSICQCGMCCACCADVKFDVSDKSGNVVGAITKPALSLGEACVKTNRFVVDFPKQCSMEDKQLLVGSAMLLDLQYFEKNKNDS